MSEGLKKKIQESIDLLTEVVEKRGAYSQDYLQHAENVIENASKRAAQVTETLKKISGWLDEATKQIQEDSNTEDEIETQVLTFADEKGKYKFPISETQFRQLKRRKWVRVAKVLSVLEGKEKAKP